MMSASAVFHRCLSALLIAAVCSTGHRSAAQSNPKTDTNQESTIASRDGYSNGIFVLPPKIYDDTSLQLMLNSARAQLASLQTISSTPQQSALGALSGGSSVQNSFGAQFSGGPSLGPVQQTNNGPTSEIATVTGTSPSVTVTNNAANQSTVTTVTPPTAPSVSLPASSGFGLPTTFGANALDILNEQMQLTYEVTNLELLLEGSLSDRFVANTRLQKTRTTVGFLITIDPPKQYKRAVAVVEVEAETAMGNTFDVEPPAITALLPREKTYNVAAITNKQASIGAGFATAVFQGGFSFLHARSTYYMVKDQDTIALQLPTEKSRTTVFAWQFKPVLGQKYVQSGMRQTFVQLAVPILATATVAGVVHVKTYWREFDEKTGKSGDVIPGSLRVYDASDLAVFNTAPSIEKVRYEDLGGGQLEVKISGRFISGTYARIGNTYFQAGTPGFTLEPTLLRFTVAASDVIKNHPKLVSRDGTEVPIAPPNDPETAETLRDETTKQNCGTVPQVTARASVLDDSTSLLSVQIKSMPIGALASASLEDYLLNISGRVFGLSDAPIERRRLPDQCTVVLRAAVPTELLAPIKSFKIQPLFFSDAHTVNGFFWESPFGSVVDKAVLLTKDDQNATFLLVGNRLEAATIVAPTATLLSFPTNDPNDPDSNYSLAKFTLTLKDWQSYKSILVRKLPGEKVEAIALPDPTAKDGSMSPSLTPKFAPSVGSDEADFTGDGLDPPPTITYNGKSLTATLTKDKKTLIVRGLLAAGVTQTPTPKDLQVEYKGGKKSTVTVNVVNYRIESNQPTAPPSSTKAQQP